MAHFKGTIKGMRKEISRLGSKNSGIKVTANGWNGGIEVYVYYDDKLKKDCYVVKRWIGGTVEPEVIIKGFIE